MCNSCMMHLDKLHIKSIMTESVRQCIALLSLLEFFCSIMRFISGRIPMGHAPVFRLLWGKFQVFHLAG